MESVDERRGPRKWPRLSILLSMVPLSFALKAASKFGVILLSREELAEFGHYFRPIHKRYVEVLSDNELIECELSPSAALLLAAGVSPTEEEG